jgi:uncharacterized membrane protein
MKTTRSFLDIVLMLILFASFVFGVMFWMFGVIGGIKIDAPLSQNISSVYFMCLGIGFILFPIALLIVYVIFSSNVKIVRLIRKYRRIKRKTKVLRKKPSEK